MLPFSRSELEKLFPQSVWNKAEELVARGALVDVVVENDGRSITGRVRGDRRTPYLTRVKVANGRGGRVRLSSTCTCFVSDCEHAAAMLLGILEQSAAPSANDVTATIDDHLEHWIQAVNGTVRELASQASRPEDDVLYVLEPLQREDTPSGLAVAIAVNTFRARRLRDGLYGREHPIPIAALTADEPPAFATPADLVIGRLLGGVASQTRRLGGRADAETLERMIGTGRCFWRTAQSPALKLGSPRAGTFRWRFDGDGCQRLFCEMEAGSEDAIVVSLGDPWYIDPQTGEAGRIDTGCDARLATLLLKAPAVPPDAATLVRQKLAQGSRNEVPLPEPLRRRERISVQPKPILHLHAPRISVVRGSGWNRRDEEEMVPLARLMFDYAGATVSWRDGRAEINHVADNRLLVIPRDTQAESRAIERLNRLGLQPLGPVGLGRFASEPLRNDFTFEEDEEDADVSLRWVEFNHREVPRLEAEGWAVTWDADYPYRVARPSGSWQAEITETDSDWFEFDLGVVIDGERISLLPVLLDLFRRAPEVLTPSALEEYGDEPVYATLPDGRLLPIPASRLRPFVEVLFEIFETRRIERNGRIRLPRPHAARFDILERELPQGSLEWHGGENLRRLAERIARFAEMPEVDPPQGLQAKLRPYQRQGLSWLQFLADCGLSGVLADDMGLGKTLQTIAHILLEKEKGRLDRPALVVAPTSLLPTWRNEVRRFAPQLRLLVLHGNSRHDQFRLIDRSDLVVTSYTLLLRDHEHLLPRHWRLCVLDEAHAIKNPSTKLARTASQIRADQRIALTGTPIENHLGELWSVFNFLLPGLLGDRETFRRVFRNPIEKEGDQARQAVLVSRVGPFMLRRTKDQVAAELPPKVEFVREIELGDEQRALYESVRLAAHTRVREEIAAHGLARSSIAILEALLKLRQVCCDPRLLKGHRGGHVESAKYELLMEMLTNMVETGRRIIVFSQFVEMLELIEAGLKKRHLPYVVLTGRSRDREEPVRRFQNGEVPIFLISLRAGGTGLTLTAADTVIHYDPWWNPAVETQATDRAHRIGQNKTVFVYKLIASGTVEERMLELQARKQALVEGVLSGARAGLTFTEEDVEALFAPLPD
ncbi:RNA polymerase-associated protein RapA [bacterium HR40]|nr:RNA polymerase-associated protein RapA [bacterium HR40]